MGPCQVVTAYLAGVRALVDFDAPLNEGYLHMLEELEELNSARAASRAVQHQRAFSCVLATLYLSLNGYARAYGKTLQEADYAAVTRPRSREDLTRAIQWLRRTMDDVLSVQMEFDISTRLVGSTATTKEKLTSHGSAKATALQRFALEACLVTRRSLLNPHTKLGRVGKCMAASAVCEGYSLLRIFEWANILLALTEDSTTWPKM